MRRGLLARPSLAVAVAASLLLGMVTPLAPASGASRSVAATQASGAVRPGHRPHGRKVPGVYQGAEVFKPPRSHTASSTVPPSFQDSTVLSGLNFPTKVAFSPDGRVFVGEKSGIIKVFDNLSDTTPTVFADLRTNVHNFWDRGLIGLALDPGFPSSPYVYVLYTFDAPIGGSPPRWGSMGATDDGCPTPPGANVPGDGCVVSGRLSRLRASGDTMVGSEQVLINDWCEEFPSHTVDSLAFGPDGALYASAGEGAAFSTRDWGQFGGSANSPVPANPCGDPNPAVDVGHAQTLPSTEGGSLRAQDVNIGSDPVTLDGSVIRIDPTTGLGVAGSPFAGSADVNARRIIAYGLRNPYRMTFRPGTNELWVGQVGSVDWESIERIADATDSTAENFGWPCYEGSHRGTFETLSTTVCQNLYAAPGSVTPPYFEYQHGNVKVFPTDTCAQGTASITGLSFYQGGTYPAAYHDALFFADYSRNCIWVMPKGANGLPDPAQGTTFAANTPSPVDLTTGPGGDLFYVDYFGGAVHRIRYFGGDQPPVARVTADQTSGPAPLTVTFDASGSSDPDPGDTLSYAWDLDNDGAFDDGTGITATATYSARGAHTARLQVTDPSAASDVATSQVLVDDTPPVPIIDTPSAGTTWSVGDSISFSGHATDTEQGTLPAASLAWSLTLQHCFTPQSCHTHSIQDYPNASSGSFIAPDHGYPSYLTLTLLATDDAGVTASTSIELDPDTVTLHFASTPSGLQVFSENASLVTPYDLTVIRGHSLSVSAPTPQSLGGQQYAFQSWSDGGAASHSIAANSAATYTAAYSPVTATTYAQDAFGRTLTNNWGNADTGGPYTLTGTAADFDVAGGVGTMVVGKAITRSAMLAGPSAQDVSIAFTAATDRAASGGWESIYGVVRHTPANAEYRVRLRFSGGQVYVGASRFSGGTETVLAPDVAAGFAYTVNTRYRVRAEIQGTSPTTLRVHAWPATQAEPASWPFVATDSTAGLQGAGSVGLRAYLSGGTTNPPVTFSFDDFLVTSIGGAGPPPPTADFTWAQVAGTPGVAFTDASTGSPTAWSWDFGDGATASIQSPSHTYASQGTYTVSLTASNSVGPSTKTLQVVVVAAPVAGFTATQQSGSLTENFTDTSSGGPTAWSWDFGDGSTSTQRNPSHTFAPAGDYTVALTASNVGGSSTRTQTVTVAPVTATTYAQDAFGRTLTNNWGNADTGGPYTLTGTAADFDVAGGVGTMVVGKAITRSAMLAGPSAQDVSIAFTAATDRAASGGWESIYGVVRHTPANAEYRVRLRFSGGQVYVGASRFSGGTETVLAPDVAAGFAYTVNTRYRVRAEIQGTSPTTLRVHAWPATQAEPASWPFVATDSTAGLQGAGSVGLRAYLSGGTTNPPVTFSFDDFLVTSIGPPPASVTLVGAGDIATCASQGDEATAALITQIPGTVFTLGDDAYDSGTAAEFQNCYDPSWGQFKARTMPTPGNHEYVTANATPYFQYFGAAAGDPARGYYAYNAGSWRIYALNSNCLPIGGCTAGTAEEQWLAADLAANPTQCIAAMWHHPRYSSGEHGNDVEMQAIWADLAAAGADIVLSGHDHDYERFAPMDANGVASPTGIREFIVGTGGNVLRGFVSVKPNSLVRNAVTNGVIQLALGDGTYSWSFVPIAGETFTDSGVGSC